jgi:hypothetical protein
MDDISRGIATAALTLQSVLLQALVAKGVLTPGQAMEVAEKALAAAATSEADGDELEIAEVTIACLEHIREGLAGMAPGN